MKKVKITILKTMLNEDLAKEYGICGLKACPMMKVGDVFYADYAKPEGFCDEAWKAIYQYVFALAMVLIKGCSTMVTGSRSPVSPLSVAMMVCVL